MIKQPKRPGHSPDNRRGRAIALPLVLMFMLGAFLFGADYDVKGFLDTYHAVGVKRPNEFLSSRTRLRMELFGAVGDASAFVSFNVQHNNVLKDQGGFRLREAYVEYASRNWDLRVGRQIIVWGKADGMQITDVISPMDLTEFLARDFDDIRTPVEAVKFRLLWDRTNIELVWVPVFKAAVMPGEGNPWALPPIRFPGAEVELTETLEPGKTLGNSEFFGKVAFFLSGVDLAFSGFYTWDDFGVTLARRIKGGSVERYKVQQSYHRVGGVGAECSVALGAFVLRAESAFYFGKRFQPEDLCGAPVKKNAVDALLGIDWNPGGQWNVSAQLVDSVILEHDRRIGKDAHSVLMTLDVTKKLLRETLTLSSMAYIDFSDEGLFNRFSVEYALTDALHLTAGVDLFLGSGGMFGVYKDNTEVFIKARYSF